MRHRQQRAARADGDGDALNQEGPVELGQGHEEGLQAVAQDQEVGAVHQHLRRHDAGRVARQHQLDQQR